MLLVTLGLSACIPAFQAAPAAGAALSEGPLAPYIVGGQRTSIEQLPWQVYVEGGPFEEGAGTITTSCGGSILDTTHILTAAHCTDVEGATTPRPDRYEILAGDSSENPVLSATAQVRKVASIRRDPLYTASPISDDVAILTLETPLELSAAKHAQAIGLVAVGASPAPGTPLEVSGYGKQEGAEAARPSGELFSATLTAISSDACRDQVGANSAVLLCAVAANSSTCQGDSGGPLTQGSPAVQVGIVDFGLRECPVGQPDVFTNLAAPEIRAFIEGSESPPIAPRPSLPPAIRPFGATAVDFGPLTCQPGAWSGSPSFTYTFQTEGAAAQALQSGPGELYTAPASLVGAQLVCVVEASNAGGLSTARSAATPVLAPDTTVPLATIRALHCHLRACTLTIRASDPNGAALGVRAWASYGVGARCPLKRRGRARRATAATACHRIATVVMAARTVSPGVFQASLGRLPYNERVTFTAVVTNAAGLHPARALTRATTLRPPPKRRPHR